MSPGWLVVSDVDHTLLEAPDQVALAGQCLQRLQRRGHVTLLASSKTFSEMVALQEEAHLDPQPFLFENGAGIGWPLAHRPALAGPAPCLRLGAYGAIVEAQPPERLTALLRRLRQGLDLRFTLLGELSFAEIRQRLGLPEAQARLALQRLASLPLVWQDGEAALERLRLQLAAQGLAVVHGGKLLHVGPPGGKGETLQRLWPWLEPWGVTAEQRLLACGDSENDRSLLERAAIALVFHPSGRPPLMLAPAAPGQCLLRRCVPAGGPRAWLAAVEAALVAVAPPP